MAKTIDITGLKYGRLTAVKVVGTLRGSKIWQFLCECGTVIERSGAQVRFGSALSCGCLRTDMSSRRKTVDMAGQRIGRLLVISRCGTSNHGAVLWECRCDCGNIKTIAGNSLRKADGTRSCGCLHREVARKIGDRCRLEKPVSRTPEYRKAQRARKRENPQVVAHERISRMLAHALSAVGAVKSGGTFDMLGYTPLELKNHIERQFLKGMTWVNRCDWQIDHIIPASSATSIEDVIALNQLSNLRPMWSKENNLKRAKIQSLL